MLENKQGTVSRLSEIIGRYAELHDLVLAVEKRDKVAAELYIHMFLKNIDSDEVIGKIRELIKKHAVQ